MEQTQILEKAEISNRQYKFIYEQIDALRESELQLTVDREENIKEYKEKIQQLEDENKELKDENKELKDGAKKFNYQIHKVLS